MADVTRPRNRKAQVALVALALINTAVGAVFHYYLWLRLVHATGLQQPWAHLGSLLFAGLALYVPVGLALVQYLPMRASRPFAVLLYLWFGALAVLLPLLGASELVRVAIRAFGVHAQPVLVSRILAGAVLGLTFLLMCIGAVSALRPVAVRSILVSLARLPKSLSGFRIVQISDLHIGPILGARWLGAVVERVNMLSPDLVAVTGDLADGSVEDLRLDVAPLARLHARHGVFFVTGNHEYYFSADDWVAEVARLGVRVLRNERVTIGAAGGAFDLVGVDDYSARRLHASHGADLDAALTGRDPACESVLLAHDPRQAKAAAAHDVGLVLSGHTHGGQIFPLSLFLRLATPHIAGLARLGRTQIYISRGTGFWGPPMRLGARSEITVIELVGEAASHPDQTMPRS